MNPTPCQHLPRLLSWMLHPSTGVLALASWEFRFFDCGQGEPLMLHHTKSCQQVLPLGSDPAALALRPVCSSVPPSLHGSGTCRAFPHHRNFPAQVAAPVAGQPEVPQLGAPACRSCSQGQSDSAEQHRDQDRQGLAQRGCSPAAEGRTLRKAWSAPQEGSVPQHGGKAGTGQPPAEQRALWWGQQGSLGTTHREQPGARDSVPHRDTRCCIQDSQETPAQKTSAWQINPGATAGSEKHHATCPWLFELGQPKSHTGLRWHRLHQTQRPWAKSCPM